MTHVRRILIAAGGSGGHLFPACQLAKRLLTYPHVEVHFAGHRLSASAFFPRSLYPFTDIESAPLSFRLSWMSAMWRGMQTMRSVRQRFPFECVVGFGSYHTVPVLAEAAWRRTRMILYEANCSLGKVNRLLAPFAEIIASPFSVSGWHSARRVSFYPWTVKEDASITQESARAHYGLAVAAPVCLVFGGSQGALFLNQNIPRLFSSCPGLQALHFTGDEEQADTVRESYREAGITAYVTSFEPCMERAYRAADMAVCRAGAGTTAELIRYCLPALTIPYPYAGNHQEENARFFHTTVRGGLFLRQKEASPEKIVQAIHVLLSLKAQFQLAIRCFNQHNGEAISLEQLVICS